MSISAVTAVPPLGGAIDSKVSVADGEAAANWNFPVCAALSPKVDLLNPSDSRYDSSRASASTSMAMPVASFLAATGGHCGVLVELLWRGEGSRGRQRWRRLCVDESSGFDGQCTG